jgi:hypothetical protein
MILLSLSCVREIVAVCHLLLVNSKCALVKSDINSLSVVMFIM